MKYQIKNHWTGEVLFDTNVPDGCEQPARFALELAVIALVMLKQL